MKLLIPPALFFLAIGGLVQGQTPPQTIDTYMALQRSPRGLTGQELFFGFVLHRRPVLPACPPGTGQPRRGRPGTRNRLRSPITFIFWAPQFTAHGLSSEARASSSSKLCLTMPPKTRSSTA